MTKRNKRLLFWGITCLCIISLLIGAEVFATSQAERIVGTALKAQFKLKEEPEVTVSSHPILVKLALGRVDRISVEARRVQPTSTVELDTLSLDIRGLRFDPLSWAQRHKLVIRGVDSAKTVVVLSEQDLNAYVKTMLPDSSVKLKNGSLVYHGKLGYLGNGKVLDIGAKVEAGQENTIKIIPSNKDIDALPLSLNDREYLKDALLVEFPVPDVPGGLQVTGITIKPGTLTIQGELTRFDFATGEK